MWLEFLLEVLVVFGVTLGISWPLAARLRLAPDEKLLAAVGLSLLGVYLFAWSIYVFALPVSSMRVLPALAALGLASHVGSVAAMLRDRAARELIIAQLLVSAWCAGWLALVITYSGAWVGDWFSHWERMRFFLERWPHETLFYGFDPLTSRPPMANVVTGALVFPVAVTFAGYQLVTSLLGSLAFMPAALLARRFLRRQPGSARPADEYPVVAILAVLFMVNPLFLQNATFAWTKLPSAFFVLGALHFFLRTHDADSPPVAAFLCSMMLGAGILVHYSAIPYALLLACAWLGLGRERWHDSAWWRSTALATVTGAVLLLTWFGWAFAVYGGKGTFLTNTTVVDQAPALGDQAWRIFLNVRDSIVPHFLRTVDFSPFAGQSPWGWWRDWLFYLYQTNLLFAFGSVAFVALLAVAIRDVRSSRRSRLFWITFGVGSVVLGVAVHSARNELGLAHICLQPFILLGLAYLAARWPGLTRAWRLALVAGGTVDFVLGVALHFGIQSRVLGQWLRPGRPDAETLLEYSQFAVMNLRAKALNQWIFFGDFFAVFWPWVVVALAATFALTLRLIHRGTKPNIPGARTQT